MAAFARDLARRMQQEFTPTMALLRSPAFQEMLMNYERRQRVFIVSDATRDVVSSEWLVRGADGTEYKPADYLIAFAEFVRAHQNDIEAIAVLLKRPRNWSPGTLQELRHKLSAAPQRFTLDNLQKAHAIRDRKAMADIISMVKHAAGQQPELLNAAERVDRAFARLTAGREFNAEQQQWLTRIQTHMQENLSLDREDFENLPVFNRYGGWGRASKVFGAELVELVAQINQEVAA
jgi:type I restriction enzyme R subunit